MNESGVPEPLQPEQPAVAPPPPPQTSSNRRLIASIGAGALLLVALSVGVTVALVNHGGHSAPKAQKAKTDLRFKNTVGLCKSADPNYNGGLKVADGGTTLTIDGQGDEEFEGASVKDEVCVLALLKAPESVVTEMSDTTALQGRQTASWKGIDASWTYHPDNGLDIILTLHSAS